MAGYGYGNIPEKGFVAFTRDLSEGAWKDVIIKKVDTPSQIARSTLLETPHPVVWKLRVTWTIAMLRDAIGVGSEVLTQLDADWDSLQRKLNFTLAIALEDKDKAKSEAAGRLHGALLLGNGTAQTILGWDEEVDFGRQQIELTSHGPLAEDAKKIGLVPLLKEIHEATEALARGLGRGPGQKRAGTRVGRMREALSACIVAFNGVHDDLVWFIAHIEEGEDRTRLEQMLAPFNALLDRYPGTTAGKAPAEPSPTPEPGPPAAPPAPPAPPAPV